MRYILVIELFQQQIVVDRIKRLLKVNQQSPNSPTLVKRSLPLMSHGYQCVGGRTLSPTAKLIAIKCWLQD